MTGGVVWGGGGRASPLARVPCLCGRPLVGVRSVGAERGSVFFCMPTHPSAACQHPLRPPSGPDGTLWRPTPPGTTAGVGARTALRPLGPWSWPCLPPVPPHDAAPAHPHRGMVPVVRGPGRCSLSCPLSKHTATGRRQCCGSTANSAPSTPVRIRPASNAYLHQVDTPSSTIVGMVIGCSDR